MRGNNEHQAAVMLYITPDQKVPQDHPIRPLKAIVDGALADLSPVFNQMYKKIGRPSIPPEHRLKATLLIGLYSVRSERQFCERLDYDLLFKWFLDQNIDTPAFDASSFSKNRTRLLEHDVARQFFEAVLEEAKRRGLLSEEHFTVDGTLLEAWASMKSVGRAWGQGTETMMARPAASRTGTWITVARSAAMRLTSRAQTRRHG